MEFPVVAADCSGRGDARKTFRWIPRAAPRSGPANRLQASCRRPRAVRPARFHGCRWRPDRRASIPTKGAARPRRGSRARSRAFHRRRDRDQAEKNEPRAGEGDTVTVKRHALRHEVGDCEEPPSRDLGLPEQGQAVPPGDAVVVPQLGALHISDGGVGEQQLPCRQSALQPRCALWWIGSMS